MSLLRRRPATSHHCPFHLHFSFGVLTGVVCCVRAGAPIVTRRRMAVRATRSLGPAHWHVAFALAVHVEYGTRSACGLAARRVTARPVRREVVIWMLSLVTGC